MFNSIAISLFPAQAQQKRLKMDFTIWRRFLRRHQEKAHPNQRDGREFPV